MSHDTLLHRALRPVVGSMVRTRITPNMLTVCRLATGLTAAACFAVGTGRFLASGAGLFLISMLLDRADGELARQSGRFSRFGGRFDLVADCVSTAAAFIGLGLGVAPVWIAPWLGALLGLAAALATVLLFAQLNLIAPRTGDPVSRPFDPDDVMVVLPVVVWCGGASWILLAAGVVTPVAACVVSWARWAARNRTAALTDVR